MRRPEISLSAFFLLVVEKAFVFVHYSVVCSCQTAAELLRHFARPRCLHQYGRDISQPADDKNKLRTMLRLIIVVALETLIHIDQEAIF